MPAPMPHGAAHVAKERPRADRPFYGPGQALAHSVAGIIRLGLTGSKIEVGFIFEKPQDCHDGLLWCPWNHSFLAPGSLENIVGNRKPYQVWIQKDKICCHWLREMCRRPWTCKYKHPSGLAEIHEAGLEQMRFPHLN